METMTENVLPHEEVMSILGVEPKDLEGDVKKLFNYLRMVKNKKTVTDERKITLSSQLSGALIIQFAESPEEAEKAKEALAEAEAAATQAAEAAQAAANQKDNPPPEPKKDEKEKLLNWEKLILQNADKGFVTTAKLKEIGFIAKDEAKVPEKIVLANKKLKYDALIDSYKITDTDSGSGFLVPALLVGAAGLFAFFGLRKR
jgi:hypothetical protein